MSSRAAVAYSPLRHLALVPKPAADRLESPALDWSERRAYERHGIVDLTWLNQIRLKYGPAVSLVDLSSGGAQIETTSSRLKPGTTVVVELVADDETIAVPASVLRAQIASLAPHAIYRGALVFKRTIDLPAAPARADEGRAGQLLHEHARLGLALKRLGESAAGANGGTPLHVGEASMAAALAVMQSPASRRAEGTFSREMSRMLAMIADGIADGVGHEQMIDRLIDGLRRIVPTRAVRLIGAGPAVGAIADAIYLDVRSTDPDAPPDKLLVEFPGACRLEQWHLQFLKAAAHLVTVIKEVDALRRAAAQAADAKREDELPLGWRRLVVRFLDGRLIKGFNREFTPARGMIQLATALNGPAASNITVPLSHLKAVFFVQDLDGRVGPPPPRSAGEVVVERGRRIDVTFADGEVLSGVTLNYTPDGPGFFMFSSDPASNNTRIFVATGAVRHVRFP
jgi:uncharacterized protein DUF6982